jgi:transposase-like protein
MKRYSKEEKAWLVEEWETSGKSKWAFARELGLQYQTFSKWTREPAVGQNFVEVGAKLEEEGLAREERTGCALVVEHGAFLVHLPAGSTAQDLAVVVQALR